MIMAARLYAQKWKTLPLPTTHEWLVKMIELPEIKEKTLLKCITLQKPIIDFLHKTEKSELIIILKTKKQSL